MKIKTYDVAETFNINVPQGIFIEGREDVGNPYVPAKDEKFVFSKESLSDVLAWVTMGCEEPLFITGPTGSGKTSLMKQVAARLKIPVQEITGHGRLEVPDMIGRVGILGGDTMFLDGPLTTAYREGHWFLLNEQDLLDPSTNAGLNGILERSPLTVLENAGEVVKAKTGFAFIATGNTAGGGDMSGSYTGTMRQNAAFMDRFWVMEVDYPEEDVEKAILSSRYPDITPAIIGGMVDVANEVRTLFKGGSVSVPGVENVNIDVTFSTRTLLRWAGLISFMKNKPNINIPIYTIDRALGFRAEPSTRFALHSIVQHIMGE